MSSKQQASYLPEFWNDESEMAGLMSHLKLRQVNPKNYDRIIDFWSNIIDNYCRHEKKCLLSFDELKVKFKRGNQLPGPLARVLEEMYIKQVIVPADELSSPRQSWLSWGASWIAKSSWLTGAKAQAKELLEFYKSEYETVDCSDVVGYDEFKTRCRDICNANTFDLVLDELMRQGEVSVGTSENGERILKFKDQTSRGPAKFTRADASVHELRRMMSKVDGELRRVEQRVKKFDAEARDAVHRKDKAGALQALRKKKRAEKEMTDKDVDETMDSVNEAMQDANDIDEALREGFSSIPMPNAHIEDSALEDELNAIMNEEKLNGKTKEKNDREFIPDLPEVPTNRLPVRSDDVAARLRRLRHGINA
ncbi:hypothetical protein M3Y98_00343300 [Aphelenchoides besseyi]|nr:hypothetical protein M3Y98_00343300 [Aphelenchoides besseyi]KAI6194382.1 hypothetical protein M3Y96_01118800 [Aphelenchoides besseyi]